MSYVEPTAAVLLALREPGAVPARNRARDFLLTLQLKDGGWGIAAMDDESGWMTAWAVRALADPSPVSGQGFPDARAAMERGARWLIQTSGIVVTDAKARARIRELYRMDSALRGFPWQVGDAAWVHPTALAILALVAANLLEHARTREGVAYLLDRALESGGWNIGNPQMIDKPIPATVQDTAVALIALRAAGVGSDDARVARGLQFLRETVTEAKTTAELAWGAWAIGSWRLEVGSWIGRLTSLQRVDGSWEGNPFYTAIALLAQEQTPTASRI